MPIAKRIVAQNWKKKMKKNKKKLNELSLLKHIAKRRVAISTYNKYDKLTQLLTRHRRTKKTDNS